MKSAVAGLALTAYFAFSLNHGMGDWSGGAGKTPRVFVTDYIHMAYDEGLGRQAAYTYFAPDAKDNTPAAADRQDGPPISHHVKAVVAEGLNVVVYQRIDAARGQPAQDAVDIYKTLRGRIVERVRVAQPAPSGS